jgi:hypothetical protein
LRSFCYNIYYNKNVHFWKEKSRFVQNISFHEVLVIQNDDENDFFCKYVKMLVKVSLRLEKLFGILLCIRDRLSRRYALFKGWVLSLTWCNKRMKIVYIFIKRLNPYKTKNMKYILNPVEYYLFNIYSIKSSLSRRINSFKSFIFD